MGKTDTRRFPRYEVQNVEGTFLFDLHAEVKNLSVGGMALEARRRLDVGRTYMFTIRKQDDLLRISGRVAWCVLTRTERVSETEVTPVYHAGIHFEDVLTERAKKIVRLIEDSTMLDVRRRIFGRFKPGAVTSVTIDSGVEFMVQKISLSGMLIETSMAPGIDEIYPMEVSLNDRHISFSGRIAYVGQPVPAAGQSQPNMHLGVEFLDLDPSGRQLMEKFIDEITRADEGVNGTSTERA